MMNRNPQIPNRKFTARFSLGLQQNSGIFSCMKNALVRSPHATVGGLVYFGRMLDKIRIHADGRLPDDLAENLGKGFDAVCCRFLRINYDELRTRTLAGGTDEDLLAWAQEHGRRVEPDDIQIWNDYMRKRGWNDELSDRLKFRLEEAHAAHRTDIQTMFDYIDFDEGRRP
jgi:gluconokinase